MKIKKICLIIVSVITVLITFNLNISNSVFAESFNSNSSEIVMDVDSLRVLKGKSVDDKNLWLARLKFLLL